MNRRVGRCRLSLARILGLRSVSPNRLPPPVAVGLFGFTSATGRSCPRSDSLPILVMKKVNANASWDRRSALPSSISSQGVGCSRCETIEWRERAAVKSDSQFHLPTGRVTQALLIYVGNISRMSPASFDFRYQNAYVKHLRLGFAAERLSSKNNSPASSGWIRIYCGWKTCESIAMSSIRR